MKKLLCSKCNDTIETIPLHCGHDMVYNEELNIFECYMGEGCGYVPLDALFCSKCANQC